MASNKRSIGDQLVNLLKNVPTIESIAAEASDLHKAVVNGDLGDLKRILETDESDVNVLDEWGHSPLYIAALKDNDDMVRLLISNGAKVNDIGDDSNPLHRASSVKTVELLLNAKANINSKDPKGNTPLHRAVMREDEKVVNLLLEHKADVALKNNEGCSALHSSCNSSGSDAAVKIIQNLISHGADVNGTDNFESTPLHYCAKWRCSKTVVKTLVANGGDLLARDYRGNCPVHYFRMYLKEDEEEFIEILKEFFPSPETANVTDMKGQTPLHISTCTSANVIDLLLKFGCDVNKRDNQGNTAMHIASGLRKGAEIVGKLIENDGNVNATDARLRRPLHEAAKTGNDSVAKLLISNKAEVDSKDELQTTPLHESAMNDECKVLETLLQNGANVNGIDKHGSTALHFAAWGNSERCAEFLLRGGANLNLKDAIGQTPLDVAICRKAEDVAKILANEIDDGTETLPRRKDMVHQDKFSNCGGNLLKVEEVANMIENKDIHREGEKDIKTYLTHILESPGIGRGCDDSEALEIQQCMENLVQTLTAHIESEDWRFRCRLLHAGSTSEGTKTRAPDEFDYIFALEEFSKHCHPVFEDIDSKTQAGLYIPAYYPNSTVITESEELDYRPECIEKEVSVSVSDYAFIEFNETPEAEPFINFAGSTTMPVYKMYDGFSQLITKIFFSRDFPKFPQLVIEETTIDPAMTLRWRGSRYKDLEISVDLVPAVILPKWPEQYQKKKTILTSDILRIPSLVVPKMTSGTDEDLWRCSLVLAETAIFRKLKPNIRNSYITCKALISSLFCPLICFGENEEAKAWYKMEHDSLSSEEEFAIHEEVDSTVPSYMLKMMFLAAVESRAKQSGLESVYTYGDNESEKEGNSIDSKEQGKTLDSDTKTDSQIHYGPAVDMNVAKRSRDLDVPLVLEVFRRCEDCIGRKFVPSFFNPKHNVLGSRAMEDGAEKAEIFIKCIARLLEG